MSTKVLIHRSHIPVIVVGILAVFQAGCSGPGDQPELGLVTGSITMDGKPLVGVAVVFQPDSGRPARGTTNAQGQYELTYIRQTKGSKVGPTRVEIAPNEEGEGAEEMEAGDEVTQNGSAQSKSGKPVVPARYNVKSELKVDVKPGENKFDFPLQSK